MEAKELMIGDIIQSQCEYYKVTDIHDDCYCCSEIPPQKLRSFLFENCDDDAKGVPITPDILLSNGWKLDEELSGDDPCLVLDLSNEDPNWMRNLAWSNDCLYLGDYHYCDCFFVHQLQHALRLLGKYEKADNFKLE